MPQDEDRFPTIASDRHAVPIDLMDAEVRAAWCVEFKITDDELGQAVQSIGAMPAALRAYFAKPRQAMASDDKKAAYLMKQAKRTPRLAPKR
jgi:hypothetical protein